MVTIHCNRYMPMIRLYMVFLNRQEVKHVKKKRRKSLVRIPEELQPVGRLKIPTLRSTQENKKQLMFTGVGTHMTVYLKTWVLGYTVAQQCINQSKAI